MESTPDGVHSLSILEAFPEDTGTYKCVARNKAGETTAICHLKVHGRFVPILKQNFLTLYRINSLIRNEALNDVGHEGVGNSILLLQI